MNFEDALIAAKKGQAIIFIGSGFSSSAQNQSGTNFPTGSELAKNLCNELSITQSLNLQQASSQFIKRKSSLELIKYIKPILTTSRVSTEHETIINVPWKAIYTTNYDDVIEISTENCGFSRKSLTLKDNKDESKNKGYILHINGSIKDLNVDTLESTFKLTSTSYLVEQFRKNPWYDIFLRELQSAQAIFFIGYSLYDTDIKEIIYQDDKFKKKTFFIEWEELNSNDIQYSELNDFGEIHPIGVKGFAEKLNSVTESQISDPRIINLTSLEEIFSTEMATANSEDVFNLLLRGNVEVSLLLNDIIKNTQNYKFNRDFEATIYDLLTKSTTDNIILTGDFASGKTLSSQSVLLKLKENNEYKVFLFKEENENSLNEIEYILETYSNIAILFEGYTYKTDVIAHANQHRKHTTKLIITTRNLEEESIYEDLASSIDWKKTNILDTTKLSNPNDINNCINYLNSYGLWGKSEELTDRQKKYHLINKCNQNMHSMLISIFDSPQIQNKIQFVFHDMQNNSELCMTLTAIFVLNILGDIDIDSTKIFTLTDDTYISKAEFRKHPSVKLLCDLRNGIIIPKSSILSYYILRKFKEPDIIVCNLIRICKNLYDSSTSFSSPNYHMYKSIVRFGRLQQYIPEKNMRESLVKFYEGIRQEIPLERGNPHFWLQYAMSYLAHPNKENLSIAKRYLETGLGCAKKRGKPYYVTDLQTQLSRYHLEYSIHVLNDINHAFEEFERANSLIQSVIKHDVNKKETYRPIRMFRAFFQKYQEDFDECQLNKIYRLCQFYLKKIQGLKVKLREEYNVIQADTDLKYIQSQIDLMNHIKLNN